ncbi:MAG: helicase [Acidobacteria bacterium]|nr:helicase [Acidobacteriota bacterium]
MRDEFEDYIPVGSKELKAANKAEGAIFKTFSNGVKTHRDSWVYNFDESVLIENVLRTSETYNDHVYKWTNSARDKSKVDDFVKYDESKISWSLGMKNFLLRGNELSYEESKVRTALYRPFCKSSFYFDEILNEARYKFPTIYPTQTTEEENVVICAGGYGRKPFAVLVSNRIPDLNLYADPQQSFPFYTYDEDGTNRRENLTDWALEKFRAQYADATITKWDIFHYVYAVLHHPLYRERYAANLKRELPRVPFAPDFHAFRRAGARLAEIHVNYEQAAEYPLARREQKGVALDWRVERMRLSKDKQSLRYNEFLTLARIPPEVYEYRLGNRSALEWVVDQYQVTIDKRSGIANDPNRADDPEYIVRLVGQVVAVSLETVKIVRELPALGLESAQPA